MRTLFLEALLAVTLAGCAGTPTVSTPEPAASRVSFDVCVLMGSYNPSSAGYVLGAKESFLQAGGSPFRSVAAVDSMDDAGDCDVVARIWQPGTFSVGLDAFAGGEDRPSLSLKTTGLGAGAQLVNALAKALAEGTPLAAKAAAARQARATEDAGSDDKEAAPSASPAAELKPLFAAPARPDDLAVIVGVESYSDIGTKALYAERDAESVRDYVRALGVPERNIAFLVGPKAVRSGIAKTVEGWLPRLAKPDSRVYFYFSGHGAPDLKTGQAYLVPWDGDPNFLETTAYPVAKLYQKLGELPAKQVLVAMDSCFSGAGGRSVLASGARPLVAKVDAGVAPAKVTVLAASAANEISGSLDESRHGAFTYFLLKGLDAGKTTPKALADYLTPLVQDEARRLNRDQTPQLQGDGSWSLR